MRIYRKLNEELLQRRIAEAVREGSQCHVHALKIVEALSKKLKSKGLAAFSAGDAVDFYIRPLSSEYGLTSKQLTRAGDALEKIGLIERFTKVREGRFVALWSVKASNFGLSYEGGKLVERASIQNKQAIEELQNLEEKDLIELGYTEEEIPYVVEEIANTIQALRGGDHG